jgi:hypothetical protein
MRFIIKTMSQFYIIVISTLIGLVLTAYGFIFRNYAERIKEIEKRPSCRFGLDKRLDRVENTQTALEPVLLQIQTHLARIETTLQFLTKDKI